MATNLIGQQVQHKDLEVVLIEKIIVGKIIIIQRSNSAYCLQDRLRPVPSRLAGGLSILIFVLLDRMQSLGIQLLVEANLVVCESHEITQNEWHAPQIALIGDDLARIPASIKISIAVGLQRSGSPYP